MVKARIKQQKSSVKWIKKGHLNIGFFHASVKAQNYSNRVISNEGLMLVTGDDIRAEVEKIYKNLLG